MSLEEAIQQAFILASQLEGQSATELNQLGHWLAELQELRVKNESFGHPNDSFVHRYLGCISE